MLVCCCLFLWFRWFVGLMVCWFVGLLLWCVMVVFGFVGRCCVVLLARYVVLMSACGCVACRMLRVACCFIVVVCWSFVVL